MALEDFVEDDNDDGSTDTENNTDNAYEEYSKFDDELNPKVASIVDEIIEEWNNDRMVECYIHEDFVNVKRGELVYGIVNIAKRTQKYFDNEETD